MTVFLLSAAALLVVALALVLPPLLGRAGAAEDQRDRLNLAVHRDRVAELEQQESDGELGRDQAQEARLEIERDLLRDSEVRSGARALRQAPRWSAVLVALAIPASAVWLYVELGTPAALQGTLAAPQSAAGVRGVPGEHSMTDLIAGLIRKLQEDPNNLQGWVMLGRSYNALERFAEAREAFGAAARLAPRDVEVLTGLAEATALANDGDLTGKPEEILHQALAIDPRPPPRSGSRGWQPRSASNTPRPSAIGRPSSRSSRTRRKRLPSRSTSWRPASRSGRARTPLPPRPLPRRPPPAARPIPRSRRRRRPRPRPWSPPPR